MHTSPSNGHASFRQLLLQCLAVLLLGLFLFLFFGSLLIGVYQVWYNGRIFPGIAVMGVDLGGLTRMQAAQRLMESAVLTPDNSITLWYTGNPLEVSPAQLGISLDLAASVNNAYDFGRRGSIAAWFTYQIGASFTTRNLPPTIIFDQNAAQETLIRIAEQFDQPVKEGSLSLDGTRVVSELGQTGRELDLSASLEQIGLQVSQMNLDQMILPVKETAPQIMDASPYANLAQEIINRSITLRMPAGQFDGGRQWQIDPQDLAAMLTFESRQQDGQIQLIPQLKTDFINAYLQEISPNIEIATENPRFIFNDESGELDLLSPGIDGRSIDYEATIDSIQTAIADGQTEVDISIISQSPQISDDSSGAELGITELVHSETSYFYGSSEARIQNIQTAASQFHGLLVPPNSTFSMADAMDAITIDNGYTEALIIYNGQTIEGVGGGVCQVSTTLFRAAFFSGFPITERHPHAYRVSYYEKTAGNRRDNNLAGLDATVYVPIIDLKFVNDTPYWLLMETYVNRSASSITWKFYSTWDGRTVNWQTSGPTNVKKPEKPLYKENPKLSSGEVKQVEWEADGADVRVDRSVFRGSDLLFEDTFVTLYEPWRAVFEYGPGTEGMPPADQAEE
jgi:vancomycin resistance protein YoaR